MEKMLQLKETMHKNYNRIDEDEVELTSLIEKGRESRTEDYFESAGHSSNLRLERRGSQLLSNGLSLTSILYSDQFLTLYPTKIEVKHYYFPLGKSKFIDIVDIVSLSTPEVMNLPWWDYMNWGRGYNSIWWAKDNERGLEKKFQAIIIKQRGENTLKAFSTENRVRVMDILKERLMLC
ncbi:hypothetical protein K502DRAFT_314007 [Neoconidiobolus thromboides FSU 785]|nr:hypothetical protein K502DRAFT_314007 [Neoconidiobolus thromboides FSU 785]